MIVCMKTLKRLFPFPFFPPLSFLLFSTTSGA
jgi:hypothetical protein